MVSKNALNALTEAQQKVFDEKNDDIIVSSVHPGEVITDMNPDFGNISPDEGMLYV
jgi:NAD(P)-dependent dehydrogenase (short-subunit alcohol dehydrogenase family)